MDVNGGRADIDFLASSENRLVVLRALADAPLDRDGLREATGCSRQTLTRIVAELEARDWVVRRDDRYRATALGTYVVREFDGLHDRLEDAQTVADVLSELPEDAADLGVEAFVGSEVVRATPADPLAPIRRAASDIREAGGVRLCAGAVTQETLSANLAAVEGGQRFEAVFDRRTSEAIRSDPTLRSLAAELLAHELVSLYTVDRELEYSVGFADDAVAFGLSDERGAPTTYLRTDDERVVAWTEVLFDELIATGEPLSLSPDD